MKVLTAWLKSYPWFRFLLKEWRRFFRQVRKRRKRIHALISRLRSRLRSKENRIIQQSQLIASQLAEIEQVQREVASLRQRVSNLREENRRLEEKTDAESEQLRTMILYWSTSVSWRRKRFLEDFIFQWLIDHLAFSSVERAFIETNFIDRDTKPEFAQIRERLGKLEADLKLGQGKTTNVFTALVRMIKARIT